MSRTTVIYGLPGTGKTTRLVSILESLMQEGYLPSEICVNTFRRSMAQEFIDRARAKFGDIDTPWMGTMHSICYSLIGKDPDVKVAEGKDFSKFFREVFNLEYREKNGDEMTDEHIDVQKDTAKALADVYHIVVNVTGKPDPSKWRETVEGCGNTYLLGLDDKQVNMFFDEWPEWKRSHNLIDFNDMLLQVYEGQLSPEAPVVIADEFQDYTFLQYEIFKIWRKDADLCYIAGDEFQCIPEGSRVLTPDGYRNIEDIRVGDIVLSVTNRSGIEKCKVSFIHKITGHVELIEFILRNGKKITTTTDHIMLTYPNFYMIPARKIRAGMSVPVCDGSSVRGEKVHEINRFEKTVTVYDLQVEPYHNYIVNGIVVHNSIYIFWGSSPKFIVGEMDKGKVDLLPKTWRFGETVWHYATRTILYKDIPHIECNGESEPVYSIDGDRFSYILPEFTENTTFLVRAGFMGAILAYSLAGLGIPFNGIGGWSDGQIEIYNILYKLRSGYRLSVGETRRLVDLFPAKILRMKKVMVNRTPIELDGSNITSVFWDNIARNILHGEEPLRYALNSKISKIGKEKIHGLLARDFGFLSRDKITVRVMTIHASKGLQDDTVVLFDDVTGKVVDSLSNEKLAQNEQRTFFVGCTRAKRRLFIVRGYFKHLNNNYGYTYPLPYNGCMEYKG